MIQRSVRLLTTTLALSASLASASLAHAARGDLEGAQGRQFARWGDCSTAIRLLEKAQSASSRPRWAVPLAGCYEKKGKLARAYQLYQEASSAKVKRGYNYLDVVDQRTARRKASRLKRILPTVRLVRAQAYRSLQVRVDGVLLPSLDDVRAVDPDRDVVVEAKAPGYRDMRLVVRLKRGERRLVGLRLEPTAAKTTAAKPTAPKPTAAKPTAPKPAAAEGTPSEASSTPSKEAPSTSTKPAKGGRSAYWLGARFQGMLLPKSVMNAFGEGGDHLFIPGGALTFTAETAGPELVFALAYGSYNLSETPFLPSDTPDTEWEIIESDMMSLAATVDLMWRLPLNSDASWNLRLGASAGLGWMFTGDLYRTQAFPLSGQPDKPENYRKCNGPNDPQGSFRYCNQLDKDADHYDGFAEPNWFNGGARPLIYPWLALPKVGLSWQPSAQTQFDLEFGVSISGVLGTLGFRYGL